MTIVIKKASGGVSVMRIIGSADAEACIEKWKTANPGQYVTHAEIAEQDLPQDRATRAKWALVDGAVVVDESLAPVPQSISPRQFRQSLNHFGYRAAIEAAVAAADQDIKDWYEFAASFERTHAVVLSMAQSLGYTSDQLDAVWTFGGSI
jgi:hypothetical protein